MAAAGRAASRLKRIIDKTPKELGRRGQPLIENNSNVAIFSYSLAVRYATDIGKEKIKTLIKIPSKSLTNFGQQFSSIEEKKVREIRLEDIDFSIEETDCLLLGCTAFLANGTIVAESGTKELVERCFESNIKVHFFADTLKLAPWLPKENSNEEFLDIIPGKYVDHVITEDGIRRPDQLLDAAADLAPMWEKLRTGDS
jgi:translation initiation factor 2B subunit (eIF-2B alpha/beta/delta family)